MFLIGDSCLIHIRGPISFYGEKFANTACQFNHMWVRTGTRQSGSPARTVEGFTHIVSFPGSIQATWTGPGRGGRPSQSRIRAETAALGVVPSTVWGVGCAFQPNRSCWLLPEVRVLRIGCTFGARHAAVDSVHSVVPPSLHISTVCVSGWEGPKQQKITSWLPRRWCPHLRSGGMPNTICNVASDDWDIVQSRQDFNGLSTLDSP